MSAIPPDIAGAAAQAGFTASAASRARDAVRSADAQRAMQQQQSQVDRADSVEADDLDTAVFADAEGAGSQGRADSGEAEGEAPSVATEPASDEPPAGHLDIQA